MRNHHASSVLIGDHLYGFSSAILTAMKFDTGQVAWQDRSVGKGSMIFADERLYLFSEQGHRRPGRGQPGRLPGTRPLPAENRVQSDLEPPGRGQRQALPAGPGHDLRLRRPREVKRPFRPGWAIMAIAPGGSHHRAAGRTELAHERRRSADREAGCTVHGAARTNHIEGISKFWQTHASKSRYSSISTTSRSASRTPSTPSSTSASCSKRSGSAATWCRRSPTATGRAAAITAGR